MTDLPPLPVALWAGGAASIVALSLFRTLRLRHTVLAGTTPSQETLTIVEESAAALGLPRAPRTVMVSPRVSPLVWCGVAPTLVLPETLWAQLDDTSRRAVVIHELAHVRRRDHRMCWLTGMIAALYWWHPIAWWAQRHLREEADIACDAWVTSLLPKNRRKYAEALLATKVFLSVPAPCCVAGLGMVSGRSRRLARRLTMVMTQRVAPKTSLIGTMAVLTIAAAGALVTPSFACPPETTKERTPQAQAGPRRGAVTIYGSTAGTEVRAARRKQASSPADARPDPFRTTADATASPEFLGEAPALEAMRAAEGARATARQDGARSESRSTSLERLEAQLRELEARLEKLQSMAGDEKGADARSSKSRQQADDELVVSPYRVLIGRPSTPRAAAARIVPGAPIAPMAPLAPLPATAPVPPRAPHAPAAPFGAMPAFPSPGPTPFAASTPAPAVLTAPAEGTEPRSYELPAGKLAALVGLMERQDVPIFIERHPNKIVVHATPEQHAVFEAFVKMIHPAGSASSGAGPSQGGLAGMTGTLEATSVKAFNAAKVTYIQSLRKEIEAVEKRKENLERHAEKVRSRADALRDYNSELHEITEQLRARAEAEAGEAQRESLRSHAAGLEATVASSESQVAELEAQAVMLETTLEEMSSSVDEIQSSIESIDEETMADESSDAEAITSDAAPESEEEAEMTEATASAQADEPTEGPDVEESDSDAPDAPAAETR